MSALVTFSGSFDVEEDVYSDETHTFYLITDFEQRAASGTIVVTFQGSVSFNWDNDDGSPDNVVVENLRIQEYEFPKGPDGGSSASRKRFR